VKRPRFLVIAGAALLVVVGGLVVRNQVKVHRNRQARAHQERINREVRAHQERINREVRANEERINREARAYETRIRSTLFQMLQPVALTNCRLERFGEAHDGGYLMCGNLLHRVRAGYSYGISGYDKWGCDIATKLRVRLHQYDCFDTAKPSCPGGKTIFHAECVGGRTTTEEGRFFDTIENQFARNGDKRKPVALKIDVEGAEWDAFLQAPDAVFEQIDQMAVEFHGVGDEKYHAVVKRLKDFFHVAHIHYNNFSCDPGMDPFPTWAYEVLFVSKRLGIADPSRAAGGLHPLDAPNNPSLTDCQPRIH
jgi:hypothetical protein